MNEDLRAMTLSMAVTLLAGKDTDADYVIKMAKAFQRHIEHGTGLS